MACRGHQFRQKDVYRVIRTELGRSAGLRFYLPPLLIALHDTAEERALLEPNLHRSRE